MLERAWLTGLASLTSHYLQRVARTLKLHLVSFGSDGDPNQSAFRDVVRECTGPDGILLPFWNAHSLLLMTSYLSSEELNNHSRSFQAVADDSLGGRLTHLIYPRLGIVGRQLRVTSAESRLADLRLILEAKPNLVMAADSHGPYREVSSGMARLARYYSKNILPLSAVCTRTVQVFSRIGMAVPLPGATIRVGFMRLDVSTMNSIPLIRQSLHDALTSLEKRLAAGV